MKLSILSANSCVSVILSRLKHLWWTWFLEEPLLGPLRHSITTWTWSCICVLPQSSTWKSWLSVELIVFSKSVSNLEMNQLIWLITPSSPLVNFIRPTQTITTWWLWLSKCLVSSCFRLMDHTSLNTTLETNHQTLKKFMKSTLHHHSVVSPWWRVLKKP